MFWWISRASIRRNLNKTLQNWSWRRKSLEVDPSWKILRSHQFHSMPRLLKDDIIIYHLQLQLQVTLLHKISDHLWMPTRHRAQLSNIISCSFLFSLLLNSRRLLWTGFNKGAGYFRFFIEGRRTGFTNILTSTHELTTAWFDEALQIAQASREVNLIPNFHHKSKTIEVSSEEFGVAKAGLTYWFFPLKLIKDAPFSLIHVLPLLSSCFPSNSPSHCEIKWQAIDDGDLRCIRRHRATQLRGKRKVFNSKRV